MTREKPRVMKGKHGRDLVAELGKGTKVKVISMEVVAVDDIWTFGS
jgi:hypothetical protein